MWFYENIEYERKSKQKQRYPHKQLQEILNKMSENI